MPVTRRTFLYGTVAGSLILTGCTSGGANVEETSQVSMTGSQFQPPNIHVDVGTTVTWTNDDGYEHTVSSASENWSFDKSVPGGESVTYTFEESAVYDVYCTIHGGSDLSGMSMKVGVGDATIENPLGGNNGGGGGGGGYG